MMGFAELISASDKTTRQERINMLTHTNTLKRAHSQCTLCLPPYSGTALLTNQHKFCIQNDFFLEHKRVLEPPCTLARAHAHTQTLDSVSVLLCFCAHKLFSTLHSPQGNSSQASPRRESSCLGAAAPPSRPFTSNPRKEIRSETNNSFSVLLCGSTGMLVVFFQTE